MRSLLGYFTFFQRYIKNYSIKAQPLYELIEYKVHYKLEEQHKFLIDEMKNDLRHDCMLAHFDSSNLLVLWQMQAIMRSAV